MTETSPGSSIHFLSSRHAEFQKCYQIRPKLVSNKLKDFPGQEPQFNLTPDPSVLKGSCYFILSLKAPK